MASGVPDLLATTGVKSIRKLTDIEDMLFTRSHTIPRDNAQLLHWGILLLGQSQVPVSHYFLIMILGPRRVQDLGALHDQFNIHECKHRIHRLLTFQNLTLMSARVRSFDPKKAYNSKPVDLLDNSL